METDDLHEPSSLRSVLASNINGFLDIFNEMQFIQLHTCVAVVVETSSGSAWCFVSVHVGHNEPLTFAFLLADVVEN